MQVSEAATIPGLETVSIEMRKLRLLDFIITLEDEAVLDDLEDFIYGYGETATDEELEMLDDRLAELDANPHDVISWEEVKKQKLEPSPQKQRLEA